MGIISELSNTLFAGDFPYKYADLSYVDKGYPHTNIDSSLVSALLDLTKCKFWLEIGSMVGGSAIKTANMIKSKGTNTEIVCVDPFIGDVYMWRSDEKARKNKVWSFLQINKCVPTIYKRFIANVAVSGASDIILPITCTSVVGIALIKALKEEKRISNTPEVIYLDSAHEVDETFLELSRCWDMLKKGGVLFGDDWNWPSVSGDVIKAFADAPITNQELTDKLTTIMQPTAKIGPILLYNNHWLICK